MLFPETSSIVKKLKISTESQKILSLDSKVLFNFAFGISYRGIIKSAFDVVRIASDNDLMICHIRSSAEFSDLLCTKTAYTLRFYGVLKQINTFLVSLLSKAKGIKFTTLTLPIVIFTDSSWDKYLSSLKGARVSCAALSHKLLVCELNMLTDFLVDFDFKSNNVVGEVITLSELLDKYQIKISTRTNLLEMIIWRYARIVDIAGCRFFVSILIKLGIVDKSCILGFELHES